LFKYLFSGPDELRRDEIDAVRIAKTKLAGRHELIESRQHDGHRKRQWREKPKSTGAEQAHDENRPSP